MAAHADIFDVLKTDHDKHRALLAAVEATNETSDERGGLFEELTLELKAHAAAEEQALYSTVMRKPDLTDSARHSVAEHQEIEEALNDLAATDMATDAWMTKFKEFAHRYTHHIDEEENEHFPEFADELTDEDVQHIRRIFERRKPEEKANAEVTPEKKDDAKE